MLKKSLFTVFTWMNDSSSPTTWCVCQVPPLESQGGVNLGDSLILVGHSVRVPRGRGVGMPTVAIPRTVPVDASSRIGSRVFRRRKYERAQQHDRQARRGVGELLQPMTCLVFDGNISWSRALHGNSILSVMAFRRQPVRSHRLARRLTGFPATFTVETVRSVHVPSTATPSGGDLLGKANGPSVFGAHSGTLNRGPADD
jgi:hypothetical protein